MNSGYDFPQIDPVIWSYGFLQIKYYSLAYLIGILFAWYYVKRLNVAFSLKINNQDIDDYVNYAVLAIVVGGRFGYMLFYDLKEFLERPTKFFEIYKGGMSFHGAILLLIITSYFYCQKKDIKFFNFTDLIASSSGVGLFLGRVANFINGELYGRVTEVSWAVKFPQGGYLPRHPSQLYEAFAEGLLSLAILNFLIYRTKIIQYRGMLSGIFLLNYALSRFIIEFFREPDPQIGFLFKYFTLGQFLNIPLLILAIIIIKLASDRKLCQQ